MGSRGAPRLRLGGVTDMSTVDWYGNVSLVAFFAGCNFRCPYCQNSSLIPLDSGREAEMEILQRRIEMNLNLLDAVVFTGGEPLLQRAALIEAAKLVKGLGLRLMVNTNGSLPDVAGELINRGLVDRVALDVKAPLTAEEYGGVIGLPQLGAEMAQNVERTLDLCNGSGVEMEIRTTVAPTVSDDPEFIRRIAFSIRDRCDAYHLQQFDNLGDILSPRLKKLSPPSVETMAQLARVAVREGVRNVYIKTREAGLERIG